MSDKGTYLRYVPKNFSPKALEMITTVNKIIDGHKKQGLTLTLRQLYYQVVVRNIMPNTNQSYSTLGRLVSDGRLAGLIDWAAIEDRTRFLRGLDFYESPSEALQKLHDVYRIDLWFNQQWRPEVWIEKDSLVGVIEDICHQLRVNFFACRGYSSQSEQWRAGQRMANYVRKGQRPIVFHLGDHDPSGLDMTRDNQERLSLFAGVPVQVVRLALNMDQVDKFNLPPNPAKLDDSRSTAYINQYGTSSWELDALDPSVLRDLIRDAVLKIRDADKWSEALQQETDDLRYLEGLIDQEHPGGFHDDEEC